MSATGGIDMSILEMNRGQPDVTQATMEQVSFSVGNGAMQSEFQSIVGQGQAQTTTRTR
jgi:hypothetical protein